MEVITIDGHQFVKASVAARQAGYTPDYVGQLARAGSVPAQLIGRTWYVDVDVLRTHKVEKKRFAREKAREQVKKAVEERKTLQGSPRALGGSRIVSTHKPVYDMDDHDLIPKIEKTAAVSDAKTVVISQGKAPLSEEYAPRTVTVKEEVEPVLEEKPGKTLSLKTDASKKTLPVRHRQVIAPRKISSAGTATVTKTAGIAEKVKSTSRKEAQASPERTMSLAAPSKNKRASLFPLIVFVVSLPLAILLATFELHTIHSAKGGVSVDKTEYVINIGILPEIFSKIGTYGK